MEVVLLLLGIVGIALVAVPRIQRRRAAVAVAPRAVGARPSQSASAPPRWPPPRLRSRPGRLRRSTRTHGTTTSAGKASRSRRSGHSRGMGALARHRVSRSPPTEPEDAPAEPVAELPSVERWRARPPGGRGVARGRRPRLGRRGRRSGTVQRRSAGAQRQRASSLTRVDAWRRLDAQGRERARGARRGIDLDAHGRARSRPSPPWLPPRAATDVAPDPALGRTYALEDDWDEEPVARPWGAPGSSDDKPAAKPAPAPRGKRKLHPVAAAGDLRRGRDRAGRAGQHDAAGRVHERAGRAPPDARARADGGADARGHGQRRRRSRGRGRQRGPRKRHAPRKRRPSGRSSVTARERWPPAATP